MPVRRLRPVRTIAGLALGFGVALALTAAAAADAAQSVTLTVHADRSGGTIDRGLVGFDFHSGGPPLSSVAPLKPRFVRIDASLEQASPARGVLNLGPLLARVAEVRRAGAEPLVILDYTPAWLGSPATPANDPTRSEPSDLAVWRDLVSRVVRTLATAPAPARWFEAWNEPDLPTYWAGTQAAWLDTAAASAHAVADVARQTGLDLRFGGPASFFPDSAQISAFVSRMRSEGLPPAFVSWHYYANYPCLGPDAPENPSDPSSVALQKALGCVNPSASPATYATGIVAVRAAVAAGSGGAPSPAPALILDEWNLSAGGLDARMTSNVGAAFDAGTLITFQAAGLDASAFYQATDTDARAGGWGTVALNGSRRPAWFAFRLWQDLAPREVALDGSDPTGGLWAVASRDATAGRLTVLLASFSVAAPADRSIRLDVESLPGLGPSTQATVERIDSAHPGGAAPERVPVSAGRVLLNLPAQAVALVTLTVPGSGPSASSRPSCRRGALLRFTIHRPPRTRIVTVEVFAGRRRIARVRGHDLRHVVIRRPARTPVTVRIVDHAANGTTVTTRRLVRSCSSTRPRTRVRHRHRRR
jgi:hypothetical protein